MAKSRNLALDIFRGLTIVVMIIVNSQGNNSPPFAQLDHAQRFGFTFADWVFPSFLFAMGNSMAFAKTSNLDNYQYDEKIIRRTILIFAIGLLLAWFPFFIYNKAGEFEWKYFENIRFMGVLQRIALCYLLAGMIIRYCPQKMHGFALFALLFLYWALLYFGAPSGLQYEKLSNLGTIIDNAIIPKSHIYRRDGGFEPEGLLGTIPATANVLAGYFTAKFVQKSTAPDRMLQNLIIFGIAAIILGIAWGQVFPISKKLWTSSYVLLCNGIDILVLAGAIYIYQMHNQKFGARFLEIFGKNPMAIYIFSMVLVKILYTIQVAKAKNLYTYLSSDIIGNLIGGPMGALVFSLLITFICFLFAFWLDKKRIILKV